MALTRQVDPISGEVVFYDEETQRSIPVDSSQGAPSTWLDLINKGLTIYQTQQLNQINVERARMGLPPIDTSQYTGVGVRVGIAPQTQQLLIYGGLALLAVMVFQSVMKRR
jgi:hypothetical protein